MGTVAIAGVANPVAAMRQQAIESFAARDRVELVCGSRFSMVVVLVERRS